MSIKVLYTTSARVEGGRREGHAVSNDGVLDVQLRSPKELGGQGDGTNPEQLFAAGYAACFDSALGLVLRQSKLRATTAVTAEVSLGENGEGGFGLAVKLRVEVDGIDREAAQQAMERAHQVCPYSNATRGNIDVTLELV
ncbi:MAG: organic hydroperoxide resistance protein [Porphyromonas pasteri]|jgi:peroxiredoxin, ohr subfamily